MPVIVEEIHRYDVFDENTALWMWSVGNAHPT